MYRYCRGRLPFLRLKSTRKRALRSELLIIISSFANYMYGCVYVIDSAPRPKIDDAAAIK